MTNVIFIISIVLYIAFIFLFTVFYFRKYFEVIKLKENIVSLEIRNNCLSNSYDSIREFKHDFSNILQSINGYIFSDNFDGLKRYYSSLLQDYNISNNSNSFNYAIINSPAVLSLISEKQRKADEFGIKFNIEVCFDFNTLNIDIYEFSRILGIFLDNSIEAAKNSDDKVINVFIRKDNNNSKDVILIENSYTDEKIDTNKIFEKNFSTKARKFRNWSF